jgi:hypothetical protein
MSLFLIGDIHGRINEYLKLLASLPPGSCSIVLGDLYLGRPGVQLPELPPEHKFLRGNHDDPVPLPDASELSWRLWVSAGR